MEKIKGNLENINRDNLIYEIRERILVDLFNESKDYIVPTEELKPNTPLSTILADAYYLHYSLIPIIRMEKNENQILENIRLALLQYINSLTYKKAKIKTELNDELSTYYAILFMKNFINIASGGEGSFSRRASPKKAEEEIAKGKTSRIAKMLEDAAKQAEIDLQKVANILKIANFGTKEGDYLKTLKLVDLIKKVDNAEQILRFAIGLIEKMPRFYTKIKRDSTIGTELGGYRLSRNMLKALARELALPEELLLIKLVSQGLLTRRKLLNKLGAIYVLLDKSGSMAGLKTIWSRSVALALFKRSIIEGRKFYLRFFDYRIYRLLQNPEEILSDILSIKSNGGTDIQKAILTAIVDLKDSHLRDQTNVIIIITDGESKISKLLLRKKLDEVNARLITIFVGENERSDNVSNLMEISDKNFFVRPSERDALSLIQQI
mgnify:CR=1 FL=1